MECKTIWSHNSITSCHLVSNRSRSICFADSCFAQISVSLRYARDQNWSSQFTCGIALASVTSFYFRVYLKVLTDDRSCSCHATGGTKAAEQSECDRCHRTFASTTGLNLHRTKKPDCTKSMYTCDVCGYNAKAHYCLKRHRTLVHTSEFSVTALDLRGIALPLLGKRLGNLQENSMPNDYCQQCGAI